MGLRFAICLIFALLAVPSADAEETCEVVRGAKIIAQDDENTYLGKVTNRYDSDSIFNEYGKYGSQYNGNSIWNAYGSFGSPYNEYSPSNKYSSRPPMLIKDQEVIGYLSANKSIKASISPSLLKALCMEEL
jgi:hypothetical protein